MFLFSLNLSPFHQRKKKKKKKRSNHQKKKIKKERKIKSVRGFMLATKTTMSCSHLCHNIQGAFVNHHFARERWHALKFEGCEVRKKLEEKESKQRCNRLEKKMMVVVAVH